MFSSKPLDLKVAENDGIYTALYVLRDLVNSFACDFRPNKLSKGDSADFYLIHLKVWVQKKSKCKVKT